MTANWDDVLGIIPKENEPFGLRNQAFFFLSFPKQKLHA
jgi:hypothetical protein